LGIKEEDVDLKAGLVIIRKHKTAKAIKKQKISSLSSLSLKDFPKCRSSEGTKAGVEGSKILRSAGISFTATGKIVSKSRG
jgi:hypothetical protein